MLLELQKSEAFSSDTIRLHLDWKKSVSMDLWASLEAYSIHMVLWGHMFSICTCMVIACVREIEIAGPSSLNFHHASQMLYVNYFIVFLLDVELSTSMNMAFAAKSPERASNQKLREQIHMAYYLQKWRRTSSIHSFTTW